jgi:hypothetical protein
MAPCLINHSDSFNFSLPLIYVEITFVRFSLKGATILCGYLPPPKFRSCKFFRSGIVSPTPNPPTSRTRDYTSSGFCRLTCWRWWLYQELTFPPAKISPQGRTPQPRGPGTTLRQASAVWLVGVGGSTRSLHSRQHSSPDQLEAKTSPQGDGSPRERLKTVRYVGFYSTGVLWNCRVQNVMPQE